MDDRSRTPAERAVCFGPFRLFPAQRLLLEGETHVRLGSRASEILIALVERAGELVNKSDLMARVWPNVVVDEGNLKVQVATLRKALGDGQPGRRFLATVPGFGYRFVAPIELSEPVERLTSTATECAHNLPGSLARPIGRADTISTLLEQLQQRRFVTVVGTGGIGKTTLAVAVAEALIETYEDGVRFVDLACLSDPQFVPSALASVLRLSVQSENVIPGLIDHLRNKRMLIVLDGCEHVAHTSAALAEQVLSGAPGVDILATSREQLRARGEHLHRLSPLAVPSSSLALTVSEALEFSAVQLFVERAAASLDGFELSDADAPVIAEICCRLDGIALAIELAATRIDAFGVRQLLALLDHRLRLLNKGRRTASPRHRTLAAALDWSYEFLPDGERILFRRLSVFSGVFTLDSAEAVATDAKVDIVEGVANLVAKSLVSADISGAVVHYRLLDTTRAYAMQKLTESGQLEEYVRRHAEYHRDLFERAELELETRPMAEWMNEYVDRINDVRSALNWAFSPSGDASIGLALTVASIPLWMRLSFTDECRKWVERALSSHRVQPNRSKLNAMKLLAALGTTLPNAGGPLPETEIAWTEALELADKLDNGKYQLWAMWGLFVYRMYVGNHREALSLAEEFWALSDKTGDADARLIGDRLIGIASHYLGDHDEARRHLDRVLTHDVAPTHWSHIIRVLVDHRLAAWTTLSRILWIQGFPDQAVRSMRGALDKARATGHPLSLCNVLGHAACPISLYVNDLATAERSVVMLLERSAEHGLTLWNGLGQCLNGVLLLARSDGTGLGGLRNAINRLREIRFGFYESTFLGLLAQGLAASGQTAEARATVDQALERCNRAEGLWCLPELLRVKGEILRLDETADALEMAEHHFIQALEWARRQEALSWELRAATSLAKLWHRGSKRAEAAQLLSSVYNRFTEGFETGDLSTAHALIHELRTTPTHP